MDNTVYATFLIPQSRLEAMQSSVDKMARRVSKGKTAAEFPPAIEATREVLMVWEKGSRTFYNPAKTYSDRAEIIPFVWVTLKYAQPILNGWKLLAVYDWEITADGTRTCYVSKVPGEFLLPSQHDCEDGRCDHCNTNRRRNKSMLIAKDYIEFKVVGSTCIKDFLGHATPNSFVEFYNFEREVSDYSEVRYQGGGASEAYIPVAEVMATASFFTRQFGYVRAGDYDNLSTADRVRLQLWPARDTVIITPTDDDRDIAKFAAEWVMTQDGSKSEYMDNLQKAIRAGAISAKRVGIVVSAVYAYQRHLERVAADSGPKCNEYLGEPKTRLKGIAATVERVRYSEGFYGTTTIVSLRTPMGHSLVWFASGYLDVQVNDVWVIDGTVKDHKEYNGTRQTVVTRVKYRAA
jgi:hypothetical protein